MRITTTGMSLASSHNIYTDAESGSDPIETEGDEPASQALPTPPRRDLMRITATGMSLASGAMASGKAISTSMTITGRRTGECTAASMQGNAGPRNYGPGASARQGTAPNSPMMP